MPIDIKRADEKRVFGRSNKPRPFSRPRGGSFVLASARGPVWMAMIALFSGGWFAADGCAFAASADDGSRNAGIEIRVSFALEQSSDATRWPIARDALDRRRG